MTEYTKHQQNIIQRYYDNRDDIDKQKLSELVTTLYLATGKKAERSWETAQTLMERLKVPASRIAHVMKQKDPTILVEVVKDLEAGRI